MRRVTRSSRSRNARTTERGPLYPSSVGANDPRLLPATARLAAEAAPLLIGSRAFVAEAFRPLAFIAALAVMRLTGM